MLNRRHFVQGSTSLLLAGRILPTWSASQPLIKRPIPSSGEMLPVMGMGSSRTFDVAMEETELAGLTRVMNAFFEGGGSLVDSSPMYGAAESVLGAVLERTPDKSQLFAATKVWIDGRESGISQMQESSERMGVPIFDLMQIHNLRDWKIHLETLRKWKQEGKIRYIGITTSHQRHHEELENIMRSQALDFVQFSYNIDNRLAEQSLLPLAADRGIATLINRPFQRGSLFQGTRNTPLPALANELGCKTWGQFFLKYIIGHPAVTCVIPATAKLHHMTDNMGANVGAIPDASQRKEMLKVFQSL
jgi:diketogulonate reductase-like aldo/keto reductase